MNWHDRFVQQAGWTRSLRDYIFHRCRFSEAQRVLEVGCGTGAVLQDLPGSGPQIHGLDISETNLMLCRRNVPRARLTCADGRLLPYPDGSFQVTFCHYLLLWIANPAQALTEMKRVTASSGHVIAFAEPDYGARHDEPAELGWLAQRQNAALARQGASLRRGSELASLFRSAGIRVTESGRLRLPEARTQSDEDWESEWQVLEADLAGSVPSADLARIKELDRRARELGRHVSNVPTYFAWGQV